MPRPSNTDQRRAQIARGLVRLLPEKGYAGASIGAIAREAGLAPGLVHYHFADKRSILVAAAEALAGRLRERFDARVEAAKGDRARLFAWLDAHLEAGGDADVEAVAAWAAVGAEAQRHPDVREVYAGFLAEDRARLEGLLGPLLPAASVGPVAVAMIALVEGFFRVGTGAPGHVPPGTASAAARTLLAAAIGGS